MSVTHESSKDDPEVGWPQPESATFLWRGQSQDGGEVQAEISGPLGTRIDRVDVLNEVPAFVKQIIAAAAGAKPYIYEYRRQMPFKINVAEEKNEEQGTIFMEATFITGDNSQ